MYALSEYTIQKPWYAFGKKPREVANTVAYMCERAQKNCGKGDYERFDGRVNNLIREFERRLTARSFHADEITFLHELQRKQTGVKAVTKHGHNYLTKNERKSGSPETAIMNSIVNKFMDYCGRRRTTNPLTGTFYTPQEAYNAMGLFGGDDSLTMDVDTKIMEKTAKEWGMILIMEEVLHGNFGVDFLARVYGPDVWFGDCNSTCDIPRQLIKLHLTVNLPVNVTPKMKLTEKARSYLLTDANTPIIGNYVRKVEEIAGAELQKDDVFAHPLVWGSQYALEDQYPNDVGSWAAAYVTTVLPDFQYQEFEAHLLKITTFDELLTMPMFHPHVEPKANKVAQMVVSNSDILDVKQTNPQPVQRDVRPPPPKLQPTTSEKLRIRNPGSNADLVPKKPKTNGRKGANGAVDTSPNPATNGPSNTKPNASLPPKNVDDKQPAAIRANLDHRDSPNKDTKSIRVSTQDAQAPPQSTPVSNTPSTNKGKTVRRHDAGWNANKPPDGDIANSKH